MKKMPRSLYYWTPPIIWMMVIFLFSSFTRKDLPEFGLFDYLIKKTGHVLEYALLAALYLRAFDAGRPTQRRSMWMALGLAGVYAITDEVHQLFVPGRTGQPLDVLIDLMGAFAGLVAWLRWSPRTRREAAVSRDT